MNAHASEIKAEDCTLKKCKIVENTEHDLFEKNEVNVSNDNKSEYENVNVNDPTTLNLNYKNPRSFLVQHGPEHVELRKYPVTNGCCFNNSWKFRNEGNERKEEHSLFYCINKDGVHCFLCLLFIIFRLVSYMEIARIVPKYRTISKNIS